VEKQGRARHVTAEQGKGGEGRERFCRTDGNRTESRILVCQSELAMQYRFPYPFVHARRLARAQLSATLAISWDISEMGVWRRRRRRKKTRQVLEATRSQVLSLVGYFLDNQFWRLTPLHSRHKWFWCYCRSGVW
jgi:hypothetical protein